MAKIRVDLGKRSYTIATGTGTWPESLSSALLRTKIGRARLFVIFDAQVYALHGRRILAELRKRNFETIELIVPSGEKAKSTPVLNDIYTYLLDHSIRRQDIVLACGGGVTSDLAGYAAATVLRGVRWGVLSTTLLGMVDAAIGGKTGINHAAGKNLIGAFWQPSFVICDTEFLHTLPERELIAGLGEVVKYAGLAGDQVLTALRDYLSGGNSRNDRLLARLIRLSAAYKAGIVSRDEREGQLRMLLNLGHTFGHAIEKALGFGRLLHGEAVLIGLLGAVELSIRSDAKRARRLASYRELLLEMMALVPVIKIDVDTVLTAMTVDKKRSVKNLRFVLLDAPGKPFITDAVSPSAARGAVKRMITQYQARGGRDAENTRRKRP